MEFLSMVLTLLFLLCLILAVVGLINPAWVKQESRIKAFGVYIGIGFFVLIFSALVDPEYGNDKTSAKPPVQKKEEPTPKKFLPLSKGEVLSLYDPIPDKIGSENTSNGSIIESYKCKHHTLELETFDGRLLRAAIKYNTLLLKSDNATGISCVLASMIFAQKIGGVNLGDVETGTKLGFDNAFQPGPNELINNGVRLKRYTNGGTFMFEAVAE